MIDKKNEEKRMTFEQLWNETSKVVREAASTPGGDEAFDATVVAAVELQKNYATAHAAIVAVINFDQMLKPSFFEPNEAEFFLGQSAQFATMDVHDATAFYTLTALVIPALRDHIHERRAMDKLKQFTEDMAKSGVKVVLLSDELVAIGLVKKKSTPSSEPPSTPPAA